MEDKTLRIVGEYQELRPQYGRAHILERWANAQGGIFEIEYNDRLTARPFVVNAFFGTKAVFGWAHGTSLADARQLILK